MKFSIKLSKALGVSIYLIIVSNSRSSPTLIFLGARQRIKRSKPAVKDPARELIPSDAIKISLYFRYSGISAL